MSEINQIELEDNILLLAARDIGVTYGGVCICYDASPKGEMQIDRTLQKLRRKGRIELRQFGSDRMWHTVSVPETGAANAA